MKSSLTSQPVDQWSKYIDNIVKAPYWHGSEGSGNPSGRESEGSSQQAGGSGESSGSATSSESHCAWYNYETCQGEGAWTTGNAAGIKYGAPDAPLSSGGACARPSLGSVIQMADKSYIGINAFMGYQCHKVRGHETPALPPAKIAHRKGWWKQHEDCNACGGGNPAIVNQPTNQTATLGAEVAITVTATVPQSGQNTFQWQKNEPESAEIVDDSSHGGWVEITGATSSTLTISNFQMSDVGSYRVVIANSTGMKVSNVVTLALASTSSSSWCCWRFQRRKSRGGRHYPAETAPRPGVGASWQAYWYQVPCCPSPSAQPPGPQPTSSCFSGNYTYSIVNPRVEKIKIRVPRLFTEDEVNGLGIVKFFPWI